MDNHRSALVLLLCILLFSSAVFLIGCVPPGGWGPPPSTTPSLNAPSALHAESVNKNRIKLTWNDNSSDETTFLIERKLVTSGSYTQIATVGANETTFTDIGLTTGLGYCYRIQASNANGNSPYSNESCAAPQLRTGVITATLDTQGGAEWYIYSLDQDDPLAFTDTPHAVIISVVNVETAFSYALAHNDRNNQQTKFIILKPGISIFFPFHGLEVEGSWTAQFNGKQIDAPTSLQVAIEWEEP